MVYPYVNVFAKGLGIDVKTLSLAITVRAAMGIGGPFLGFIADKRGRKFGMMVGLLMFTIGTSLMVFWPSVVSFYFSLSLTFLGNLVFIPAMQAYLGDRIAYRQRGRALAITELGWSLSFIVGAFLMGILIAWRGWEAPFYILTVFGILSMAGLQLLIPGGDNEGRINTKIWRNFLLVGTTSSAVAGLFMGAAMSMSNELINLSFGVWMEESFNVKIAALAVATLFIGFFELIGEGLVSLFVDRLGKARAVGIGLFLTSLAALVLPLTGRNLIGGMFGLSMYYLLFEFAIVSSIPLMTEVLPTARATLMASYIASLSAGRALGALVAPYIYSANYLSGILGIVLFSCALNLIALLALQWIKISPGSVDDKAGNN